MSPASLAGLSLKQRQEAIRRAAAGAAADPSTVKPFSDPQPYQGRLLEGYHSRKLDEITWAKIAFHLAAGVPIIKIAEYYRLSRSTIWRALSQSHNLRRRVAEERALMRREADSRFVAMRELVVDTLYRAVADGNMRATIWAAERLGLGMGLLQQAERPPKPGYARIPAGWFPTPEKATAIMADLDAPPGTPVPLPVPEESPAAAPRRRRRRVPLHPHGFEPPPPTRTRQADAHAVAADDAVTDAVAADAAVTNAVTADARATDAMMTAPPPPDDPDASPHPQPPSRRTPGPRGQAPDLTTQDSDATAPAADSGPRAPAFAGEAIKQGEAIMAGEATRDRTPDPAAPVPRRRVSSTCPPLPRTPVSRRLTDGVRNARPRAAIRLLAWFLHNCRPAADGIDGAPGLSAARQDARSRWLSWGDGTMDLCDRT